MKKPPPPTFDAALDRIRAYARSAGLTSARLARSADVSEFTTRKMALPGWSPSGATVRAIEAVIPKRWAAGDPVGGKAGRARGPGRQTARGAITAWNRRAKA